MSQELIEQLVAGALFDFAGFLTTMDQPATFSGRHDAAVAVELLSEWAAKRGLNLDEARVKDWSAALRQQAARVDEVCEGCQGHGEVGGLTPQGYDSQQCPFCHGTGKEAALSAQPAPPEFIGGDTLLDALSTTPEQAQDAAAWIKEHFAAQPAERQGEAVAEVCKGAFGIHYIACADPQKLPAGTKLYTPAAPVGVPDGWREDVALAAQMLTWGADEGLTESQARDVRAHQSKLFAMLAAAPSAPEGDGVPVFRERSNHWVHRGPDGIPCFCWANSDHAIGAEVSAPEGDGGAG